MTEEKDTSQENQVRQVTLLHLLMAIAFFMPVEALIIQVHQAGGGAVRYVLGVPLAVGLGALIVRFDWTFGKPLWLWSKRHSPKVQNAIGLALFTLLIVWIAVGAIAGHALASLLIRHIFFV
jgi:hypothetical protein